MLRFCIIVNLEKIFLFATNGISLSLHLCVTDLRKGTVMKFEKALINDRLRVSKVS